MAENQVSEMTTSEFRTYVKTLTSEQAEKARSERRAVTKARWAASNPERRRETGRNRWRVWVANLSDEDREEFRARERERKRRERAKKS